MILRSIILENFGLYRGHTRLDVSPRTRRGEVLPVALIGGKNGAGKTTLLEAVRLTLYGRLALGNRVGQTEYEDYLRGRIHHPLDAGQPPQGAAVGIEFDFGDQGRIRSYRVRRSWAARGRTVAESLLIEQDGTLLSGVKRDEWQDFLHELIPVGVSQLFFFDGEKIADIASRSDDSEQLAGAVRSLLGIELIGRLRADLGLYLARRQRPHSDRGLTRLESLRGEIASLKAQLRDLRDDLASLVTQRDTQTREAERVHRRFVAEGGDLAFRRTHIVAELDDVTRDVAKCHAELRDMSNGLLPFTLAPRLVRSLLAAADSAADHNELTIRAKVVDELQEAVQRWQHAALPARVASWEDLHWRDLRTFLTMWSSERHEVASADPALHIGREAVTRLDDAERRIRPRAIALANELETLSSRERDLRALLHRVDTGESNSLLEELRHAEQRVGATQATIEAREAELQRLTHALSVLDREHAQLLSSQEDARTADNRAELAQRASKVLASFERRLLNAKVAQLQREFVHCYNRLARKGEAVAEVLIDVDTFAVTLINQAGREVPKCELSAGEKQIYAISVLWALARTSGRALPVIIDTPLARLDSDHRANLLERYFPYASHQVIMLSTDTEVDSALFTVLQPHIARSYRLEFNAQYGSTTLESGYFWARPTPSSAEVAHAL